MGTSVSGITCKTCARSVLQRNRRERWRFIRNDDDSARSADRYAFYTHRHNNIIRTDAAAVDRDRRRYNMSFIYIIRARCAAASVGVYTPCYSRRGGRT